MAEPLDVDILNAFMARIVTSASGVIPATSNITNPAVQVGLPLVAFEPPKDVNGNGLRHLRVAPIMRAEPFHPGLSFSGHTERRGILQIDAVIPDNTGEPNGLRLAALVAARFPIGTDLIAGTRRLRLYKEPTIAAAVKDAPWVRYPVSIPYLVIT